MGATISSLPLSNNVGDPTESGSQRNLGDGVVVRKNSLFDACDGRVMVHPHAQDGSGGERGGGDYPSKG